LHDRITNAVASAARAGLEFDPGEVACDHLSRVVSSVEKELAEIQTKEQKKLKRMMCIRVQGQRLLSANNLPLLPPKCRIMFRLRPAVRHSKKW